MKNDFELVATRLAVRTIEILRRVENRESTREKRTQYESTKIGFQAGKR